MNVTLFRELVKTSSGIIVNKILMSAVGIQMATFLSDLIDRDSYFIKHNQKYDGWFYSIKERRCEELGESEKTLQRLMSEAIKSGFVDTVMKGQPAKQWIFIKYDAIYQLMESFLSLTQTGYTSLTQTGYTSLTQNGEAIYNHTNNHTKKTLSVTEENPAYVLLANQLSRIVRKHYPKDIITDKKIKDWIVPIKKIFKEWSGTPDELKEWLKLYYIHHDPKNKYSPVIRSGNGLLDRMKGGQLEGFVNRLNQSPKQKIIQPVKESKGTTNPYTNYNEDLIADDSYDDLLVDVKRRKR